jgi:hypothetical protein
MSHRGKGLIIIMAVLLLKAMSHKTRFIALKRAIRAGLNFIEPLARDGTNIGRGRDKIPGASALKRSNLLSHGRLPFKMTLSIPIRSRLEGNRDTVLTRRVTIRWTTKMSHRKRRGKLVRRRRHREEEEEEEEEEDDEEEEEEDIQKKKKKKKKKTYRRRRRRRRRHTEEEEEEEGTSGGGSRT